MGKPETIIALLETNQGLEIPKHAQNVEIVEAIVAANFLCLSSLSQTSQNPLSRFRQI